MGRLDLISSPVLMQLWTGSKASITPTTERRVIVLAAQERPLLSMSKLYRCALLLSWNEAQEVVREVWLDD